MIRVLTYLFFFVVTLFVLIHFLGLYLGLANVFTAFILYTGSFIVIDRIFFFLNKGWRKSNWRVSFWMTLAMLLLIEFTLRYGTRNHLSDSELRGNFITTCPYTEVKLERFVKKVFSPEKDLTLRVYDPNVTRSESFGNEFEYVHTYNSIGLRDNNPLPGSLDTSYVIVGLGDSFTEGLGCPQDSTWIRQLDVKLRPDIPNLIAVNAGHSGSDPFYEIYKLKHLIYEAYHPDLVILNINATDINEIVYKGGPERFSKNAKRYRNGPWWKSLYISLHSFRMILHEFFGIQSHYYTDTDFARLQERSLELIHEEISGNLIPFARANNLDLVIVFTPILEELRIGAFPLQEINRLLEQTSPDLATINMFDRFIELDLDFEKFFWKEDIHNNSMGYGIWADAIAEKVREIHDTSSN